MIALAQRLAAWPTRCFTIMLIAAVIMQLLILLIPARLWLPNTDLLIHACCFRESILFIFSSY